MFWTVGEIKDGFLQIGNTIVPVYTPETKMKVPDVLFYENAQVKSLQWTISASDCYILTIYFCRFR